jgi:pimeloyl-ACP methyl ester carboxylesterase
VHAHGGAIQAGIPNVERVIVPGASHFVHLERPEAFNEMVARFLEPMRSAR